MIEIFGLGEYDRQNRECADAMRDGRAEPYVKPVWVPFRGSTTFPRPTPEHLTLRMLAEDAEGLRPSSGHPPVKIRLDGERWLVVRVGVAERSPLGTPIGAVDVEVIRWRESRMGG